MLEKKNSPAIVIVRGPTNELMLSPKHSTIIPSTVEATDNEVRVEVTLPPLLGVRTPRNAGLPCVSSVLLPLIFMLNKAWPCGEVALHCMMLPGRVQVKMTVSSGQATVGVDVRVAA